MGPDSVAVGTFLERRTYLSARKPNHRIRVDRNVRPPKPTAWPHPTFLFSWIRVSQPDMRTASFSHSSQFPSGIGISAAFNSGGEPQAERGPEFVMSRMLSIKFKRPGNVAMSSIRSQKSYVVSCEPARRESIRKKFGA